MRTRAGVKAVDARDFAGALSAHARELSVRWYSPHLVKQSESVVARFFDHLKRKRVRDLRAVVEEHVTSYARELTTMSNARGASYSVATQRTYLTTIQRFFRFLLRQGVILSDPTKELSLPHWKKLPRAILNQAQGRRLLAAPDVSTARGKRDLAILELLYGAAIRVGECERLDINDVDLSKELVMIRSGKGRKDRMVPLIGRAKEAIDVYLRDVRPEIVKNPKEQAVFLARSGERLRVKMIQSLVRAHAKAAGLDIRVTPHTLRHGCATHLLERGASIVAVQKLLGHAQVATTALYTQVSTKGLSAAISKAHPRERWGGRKVQSPQRKKLWRRA